MSLHSEEGKKNGQEYVVFISFQNKAASENFMDSRNPDYCCRDFHAYT
jgi:hypothetical protein